MFTTSLKHIICLGVHLILLSRPESHISIGVRSYAAPCSYLPQPPLFATLSLVFRHYWNFYPACFTYYHSTIPSSCFMPIFLDTRLELFCACIFDLVDRLTHSTWELGYSSEHSDIGLYPQLTTANCTARSSFSSISPRLDARCALPPLLQTKPVQKLCLSCHGP